MKRFRLLIVLIGVAAMTAGGVVLVPVTASAAGPTYVDVSSTQGWQQTPVTLHRGDKVSLWYETGSWSVDHVNFPYVGPGGYSSAVDQKIYQGCKLNPSWVYGLMLGRIGNGPTMVVGKAATLTADRDGPLQLRIHDGDACLGDNAGAIRMEYSVQAAPPTFSPAVAFSPSSGAVGTSFTITGSGWLPGGTVTATLPHGSPGWFTGYQTPTVDANGHFSYKETVGTGPHGPTPPGKYTITYTEKYHGISLSASQKFTVTLPDFPWGGYGLYPDSGVHVKSVSATWKVPKVNCAKGGRTAAWVGMWGKAENSWLPQIGTSSDCSQLFTYTAVYQLPTNGNPWLTVLSGLQYLAAGPQTLLLFPVHAGDKISASVTYKGPTLIGQQKFRIWIKNQNTGQKWSHEITTPIPATLDQVASGGGAIVEDDNHGLAEFNPGQGHRLDITRLNVTFDRNPAHWTAKPYRIALNGHYLIGPVSKLTSNDSFYVTWKATK